jgi:hypothetical protein
LLFSLLKFIVSHFPELSEFLCIPVFSFTLFLSSFHLQGPGSVDGLLHFEFAALLLFVKTIRFILGLRDLFVENMFLSVLESAQLFDLAIDHSLANGKLFFESSLFSVLSLIVHSQFLLGECFDSGLLSKLFLSNQLSLTNLVRVSLHDICLD